MYWKDQAGNWRIERRKTWLDDQETNAAPTTSRPTSIDGPSEPRGPRKAPQPINGQAVEERHLA
jgi:hypothetical protein